jgi:hypothetical protein
VFNTGRYHTPKTEPQEFHFRVADDTSGIVPGTNATS